LKKYNFIYIFLTAEYRTRNNECRSKVFYHFNSKKDRAKRFNTSSFEIPYTTFDIQITIT